VQHGGGGVKRVRFRPRTEVRAGDGRSVGSIYENDTYRYYMRSGLEFRCIGSRTLFGFPTAAGGPLPACGTEVIERGRVGGAPSGATL